MRPQTALEVGENRRVLYNQQYDYYYMLTQQGQQIKVNKNGESLGKFVKHFTGFANSKERKNMSLKDRCLMYTEPPLNYQKDQKFIYPKGSKFIGYFQSPYCINNHLAQHLQSQSYQKSLISRSTQKLQSNANKKNSFGSFKHLLTNSFKSKNKSLKNFKSLKSLSNQSFKMTNFDLLYEQNQKQFLGCYLKNRNKQKQIKLQKSIILEAALNYEKQLRDQQKQKKCKLSSTFHTSGDETQYQWNRKDKSPKSYFQQSLNSIQSVFNPNAVDQNIFKEWSIHNKMPPKCKNTLNSLSVKSKCYVKSCHNKQLFLKRRYYKKRQIQNETTLKQYEQQLQEDQKQMKLIRDLKQSLKKYQPVINQVTIQTKVQKKGKENNIKLKKQK